MTLAKKGFANILPAMRYYKKQIIFAILFVAILLRMVAFCVPDYETVENMHPMTGAVLLLVDNLVNPIGVDVVKELVKVELSEGILTIGNKTLEDLTLITSINDLCVGVGEIFVCMTFFISLFLSKDRDLQEEIIKKVVYFVAALALVWYAQDICFGITGIGSRIAEKVGTFESISTSTDHDIKQKFFEACYVDDNAFLPFVQEGVKAIGMYVQLLIPSISMLACMVITKATCWSRAFEIIILSTFSPLAFADVSGLDHFGHGGGSRFIKNVCALSISGAIILFVMMFCSLTVADILTAALSQNSVSGIIGSFSDVLVISFAQVGLVMKSQSISKTLLGVG